MATCVWLFLGLVCFRLFFHLFQAFSNVIPRTRFPSIWDSIIPRRVRLKDRVQRPEWEIASRGGRQTRTFSSRTEEVSWGKPPSHHVRMFRWPSLIIVYRLLKTRAGILPFSGSDPGAGRRPALAPGGPSLTDDASSSTWSFAQWDPGCGPPSGGRRAFFRASLFRKSKTIHTRLTCQDIFEKTI